MITRKLTVTITKMISITRITLVAGVILFSYVIHFLVVTVKKMVKIGVHLRKLSQN